MPRGRGTEIATALSSGREQASSSSKNSTHGLARAPAPVAALAADLVLVPGGRALVGTGIPHLGKGDHATYHKKLAQVTERAKAVLAAGKYIADNFKGKKVALNKGSNVHYLLVKALEKEGLRWFTETDVSVADDENLEVLPRIAQRCRQTRREA